MFLPESCVKSPGKILRMDKGNPCYTQYFQSLYQEFEKKICQENLIGSEELSLVLENEATKLLNTAEKLLWSYGVKLIVFKGKGSTVLLVAFLNTLIETIFVFPRSLITKLSVSPIHICNSEKDLPFNQSTLLCEDNWFIASTFKSKQEIVNKVHKLIESWTKRTSKEVFALKCKTVCLDTKKDELSPIRTHAGSAPIYLRSCLKPKGSFLSSTPSLTNEPIGHSHSSSFSNERPNKRKHKLSVSFKDDSD